VCRVVAQDGFMPISFADRGRRLVYSEGIWVLAILTAILLTIFGGVTDRLIPLYAVGAFLAFTLSQAGMVAHWKRNRGAGSGRSMFINGLGALVTGITVLIVLVAKFTDGAWVTAFMIPALMIFLYGVRRHYDHVREEISSDTPLSLGSVSEPIVVVPLQQWTVVGKRGLQQALVLSKEVKVLHITSADREADVFCAKWNEYVGQPAKSAGYPEPELVIIESPYRFVVQPIVDFVIQLAKENGDRRVLVGVPELVEREWYQYFLHNQRAALLKTLLLVQGNDRISVINMPWYLKR
jgi:hypothetical protein